MANCKSRFSKQTFPEYLKLGLALKITKDCLQSLVETEAQEFHQSVLQEIQGKPPCTECKLENIVECPTAGLCKAKRCPFHTSSLKQPRQCPNGVCNIFRDRIRHAFRQYKSSNAEPSWRNTDIRRWLNDPFQLMKCFLPPGEYNEVKSTRELDLYGLLSVILNNKRFDEKFSDDLSKEDNICSKVVKIGRVYRKCESLTLTEMEVVEYVDVLITLLADPKIPFQHKAENAAEKLKQLRVDNLQTSTQEVTAILAEALHDSFDNISNGTAYNTLELRINLLTCCREIFSRESRKIKTRQLESLVAEERPAINKLKEVAKKKQQDHTRRRIENEAPVPQRKSADGKSRQASTGKGFSIQPNPCRTKDYDELKTVSGPSKQEWEECFCKDASSAKTLGDKLLKNHIFPDQSTLDRLCEKFGRKDVMVSTVCHKLCVYIQSKISKNVQIVPCFTQRNDDCNNIHFVVYTNYRLSRKELHEITYSIKVRKMGEYRLPGKKNDHERHVEDHRLSMKDIAILKICINKHASSLLAKHKMLSIISPSTVRSKQDGSKMEREPCIALYVRTKYYIPIDEEPFETNYDGIPVDVREGEFMTHPGTRTNAVEEDVLKMGCQIGNKSNSGTLGGFIEHPHYGLCGFSCAHVLLKSDLMKSLKQCGMINWPNFTKNDTVYQPAASGKDVGRLVQAVYTAGVDGQSGVEVAMFQIERRHPNAGSFYGHDSMRFDSGKTHGFSRIGNNSVVKFGYTTKQTSGNFTLNEPLTTVRAFDHEDFNVGSCSLTLHNQLEVKSLDESFSYFGDSGSLVFMKESGEDGEYTCVGMVEGGTTDGKITIVTPIVSILEAFNVPSLKNFETTTLFAELRNVRTDIKKMRRSIMKEMRNLSARLPDNKPEPSV